MMVRRSGRSIDAASPGWILPCLNRQKGAGRRWQRTELFLCMAMRGIQLIRLLPWPFCGRHLMDGMCIYGTLYLQRDVKWMSNILIIKRMIRSFALWKELPWNERLCHNKLLRRPDQAERKGWGGSYRVFYFSMSCCRHDGFSLSPPAEWCGIILLWWWQ